MKVERISPRCKLGVEYNDEGAIVTGTPREILDMLAACAMALGANGFDISGLRREAVAIKEEMDAEYAQDNLC